jgi:hypothetical protein
MAFLIAGRPDAVGGYAHGDEIYEMIRLTVDGKERDIGDVSDITEFSCFTLEVWSRGFDPSEPDSEILKHYKKFIVSEGGISVDQSVEWLGEYEIKYAYMAMLPPFKTETDSYYTELDKARKPICSASDMSGRDSAVYLTGTTGLTFCMSAARYITDVKEGINFFISDNGGVPYNKLYFVLPHNNAAHKGDVWKSLTSYSVQKS